MNDGDCGIIPPILCHRCGHPQWRHYLGHSWCIGMRDEIPKCDCTSFKHPPKTDYCIRCGRAHAEGECGRNTP